MFAVITKFSPNSNDTNYLSPAAIEGIIIRGNLNPNGENIINPEYFDHEIFIDMFIAAVNFRDSLPVDAKILQYHSYRDEETKNVLTVQIYRTLQNFLDGKSTPAHAQLITARTPFLNKINVSMEPPKGGDVPQWDETFCSSKDNLVALTYSEVNNLYESFNTL